MAEEEYRHQTGTSCEMVAKYSSENCQDLYEVKFGAAAGTRLVGLVSLFQ